MSDTPDNDKTVVLGGAAANPPTPNPAPVAATPDANHTPRVAAPAGAADSQNALPVGTRLGEFEIVGLVGEGGFGIVYLAQDHSLGRKIALKEYMPASLAARKGDTSVAVRSERHRETFEIGRRSFVNEARLLAQFDHNALVKVYRFWEANGTAYMVMPYYEGKTLRDVLLTRGSVPDEAWIRRIIAPVMDALEIIHGESCFHRDIAPDNIMLLRDERPVLLDFGAARRVIGDMTQALTVILKPGYAPIEQYAEMPGMKQGPWTDIYALAAVVYFMVLGKTPPPSVGRMMQDSFEPLFTVAAGRYSEAFLRAVDACLAVKAEDRPQNIAAMRALFGWDAGFDAPSSVGGPRTAASTQAQGQARTLSPDEQTRPLPPKTTEARPNERAENRDATPLKRDNAIEGVAIADTAAANAQVGGRSGLLIGAAVVAVAAVGGGAYWWLQHRGNDLPELPPVAQSPVVAPVTPVAQTSTPAVSTTSPANQQSGAVTPPPVSETPKPVQPMALQDAWQALPGFTAGDWRPQIDKLKTRLVVGKEALTLTLRSPQPGFAYLLLWDKATGRVSQVFPNALDNDNAISPAKPLALPRANWAYKADQPLGDWELMAILSPVKRDFALLGFSSQDGMAAIAAADLENALGRAGAKGLAGMTVCSDPANCPAQFGAMGFTVSEGEALASATEPAAQTGTRQRPSNANRETPADPNSGTQAERDYMKKLNKDLDKLLEGQK